MGSLRLRTRRSSTQANTARLARQDWLDEPRFRVRENVSHAPGSVSELDSRGDTSPQASNPMSPLLSRADVGRRKPLVPDWPQCDIVGGFATSRPPPQNAAKAIVLAPVAGRWRLPRRRHIPDADGADHLAQRGARIRL